MQNLDNISINFILSTARTGSTLLSSMLNMHSEVISTVEEPFAYNLYQRYYKVNKWSDDTIEKYCDDFYLFSNGKLELQFGSKVDLYNILKTNQAKLNITNAIKLSYLTFFPDKNKDNITTIVDKQLHFHFHLEDIIKYYPSAKFIILIRDPRDTVFLKQQYAIKNNKKKDIYILAKLWDYIYCSIFKKLEKIDKNRFIIIRYEDLVSNPEIELTNICNFLDIRFNENLLNSHKTIQLEFDKKINILDDEAKKKYTIDIKSLTEKINSDKIDLWKTKLSKKESDLIWSICGDTALKYNYQVSTSEKIFYSDLINFSYYSIFLFKTIIIQKLYKLLPIKIKFIIKNRSK